MLEIEKKRAEEIDKTMSVSINLETGQSSLKIDEQDAEFSYARQNEDVNKFLQNQVAFKKSNALFRPFEASQGCDDTETQDLEKQFNTLSSFKFKAAILNDEKSKKLYEKLRPDQI